MIKSVSHNQLNTASDEIDRIFKIQKANQYTIANSTYKERKAKLKKLQKAIIKYRPQIKEALFNDYKKHPTEVDITEIYPLTSEIKIARSNLRSWMMEKNVSTPIAMIGSSSYIHYEPKGLSLIISPWNFPFNLTFGPLVSAISAGNTVILKPSEMTPHSSALMKTIVKEIFEENEIALVEGGIETSKHLLSLPFNHIFFTGSPQVGKIVMKAAAKHLSSVTLELGGKSPTIVDKTANVKISAQRIAWGKFLNNGQICLAPDHVFVHDSIKAEFLKIVKETIEKFYTDDIVNESSYCRLVNAKHFKRIKNSVEDSLLKGANIETNVDFNAEDNYYPPTVLTNAPDDSRIMKEEIFGPVLPVFGFSDLDVVIEKINSREKPLALYVYSKSKKNIRKVLNNTRAGGTCINHNAAHFYNGNLPFGGSNHSGIGKAHGRNGFIEFSNERAVYKQHISNALELLMPPYNNFKQKLIDITIKWL